MLESFELIKFDQIIRPDLVFGVSLIFVKCELTDKSDVFHDRNKLMLDDRDGGWL